MTVKNCQFINYVLICKYYFMAVFNHNYVKINSNFNSKLMKKLNFKYKGLNYFLK